MRLKDGLNQVPMSNYNDGLEESGLCPNGCRASRRVWTGCPNIEKQACGGATLGREFRALRAGWPSRSN